MGICCLYVFENDDIIVLLMDLNYIKQIMKVKFRDE